jgi:hypothetical protein
MMTVMYAETLEQPHCMTMAKVKGQSYTLDTVLESQRTRKVPTLFSCNGSFHLKMVNPSAQAFKCHSCEWPVVMFLYAI